jgi:hypothetical protein
LWLEGRDVGHDPGDGIGERTESAATVGECRFGAEQGAHEMDQITGVGRVGSIPRSAHHRMNAAQSSR